MCNVESLDFLFDRSFLFLALRRAQDRDHDRKYYRKVNQTHQFSPSNYLKGSLSFEGIVKTFGGFLSEQPINFIFDHSITFADGFFELRAVQDLDAPADVADCADILQVSCGDRNAFAAHTQHVGNQFLRHDQLISFYAVMTEQQPPAELLFNRVKTVTNCRLRYLSD